MKNFHPEDEPQQEPASVHGILTEDPALMKQLKRLALREESMRDHPAHLNLIPVKQNPDCSKTEKDGNCR